MNLITLIINKKFELSLSLLLFGFLLRAAGRPDQIIPNTKQ